jgi:hypothetical protein
MHVSNWLESHNQLDCSKLMLLKQLDMKSECKIVPNSLSIPHSALTHLNPRLSSIILSFAWPNHTNKAIILYI